MRNRLLVLLFIIPCVLHAQTGRVPDSQCMYRLGDNPAWAAANVDPSGWKPYTEYHLTGDAYVVWVRCSAVFDTAGGRQPAIVVGSDGPEQVQAFVDGNPVNASAYSPRLFPIAPGPAGATHTVALRVTQPQLEPGFTPGRPVYLRWGDVSDMLASNMAQAFDYLSEFVPVYSSFLVIGASGLFLLGIFVFDRSQKAAFWLGLYCLSVGLPRFSEVGHQLSFKIPDWEDGLSFGLAMFESWALVRVNFALNRRRVPVVYWVVFAAWVFMFFGSLLPVFLPPQTALPLSLFVQVTCFKPVWCIWGFACTAPFVAFWPWSRLSRRRRTVAALCAVWALIEGWYQLQQVVLNRNTWSNQVQDWVSLAVAGLVIALLASIFHEQHRAADERAEMRGELSAARQVQHLLIPEKMQVAPGISISSAFLPAHEVGGDFYLCRTLPNGAQRVILGDVSGKGVAAALTSALLLGAANRCDDLRPAAVLMELNVALQNSGISGFTTCLCADVLSSGVLHIANAGQLPPYHNGREIEIPPDIPLGIGVAAQYAESSLHLAPGDTLTFLSDGVVEARNAVGELFGFERTLQISSRTAQQIADAAVAFGQQDDITVLTLSLTPSLALA